MSCDDISLDVITISSWLSADEAKRKRRCDVVLEIQQMKNSRNYRRFSRNAKISRRNVLSIQTQEDSGEAFDEPDASINSIHSRAYLYQLLIYIQSRATVSSRKKSRRKESKK
ncbi:cohesin subunit rad21 [Dorcoceras hygrometricum]|uniref:Cohesin subunit rad21 n=1 Tax=Dorcoceras hygrometricum TaxID=472368 RepID=A0A2Z7D1E5_9LAMI|nr:cohesin subunit rad21 [Dorcoceras hygrometricum]